MASISDIYGSGKFIRSDSEGCIDIEGKPYEFMGTIASVKVHEFPPEKGEEIGKKQIVVAFTELPEMELGLNVTNARAISKIAGTEEFNQWSGTRVELFVVPEEKSKTGHAIRIRKPRGTPTPNGHAQAPAVRLFGNEAANRLSLRLDKEERKLDNLRAWLVHKFPAHAVTLAKDPPTWPMEVGQEIAKWFATKPEPSVIDESDIPF